MGASGGTNGSYQIACPEEDCLILNVKTRMVKILGIGPKDGDWEDDKKATMHKIGQPADF